MRLAVKTVPRSLLGKKRGPRGTVANRHGPMSGKNPTQKKHSSTQADEIGGYELKPQ